MSILARLRETTAPAHEKLDAGVELERRLARHEDRIGLVQAFHAFHSASEALLRRWLPAGHDLDARSRIASLEADLRALGAEPVAPSATTPADTCSCTIVQSRRRNRNDPSTLSSDHSTVSPGGLACIT